MFLGLGRIRGVVVRKMRTSGSLLLVALLQSAVVTGFNLSPLLGRLGAPRNGVSLVAVSSRPQAAARGSVAGAARVGYRLCMTKGNNENQVSVDTDIVQGEEERVALWEEIEREELRMKLAAESEQFDEAASLRDSMRNLRLRDPYIRAEEDLKKAVAEERYDEAERLKQVMKDVGKPPDSQMEKKLSNLAGLKKDDDDTIKPYSDTTTNGVRVRVDSFYIADQSAPADGRFLFGYNVTVTNLGDKPVQLIARTWLIRTESSNRVEEVSGSGVVGRQPVLEHGEAFRYASACPLNVAMSYMNDLPSSRVLGSMEGSYTMVSGALGQDAFKARINPFCFVLPEDVA